MSVREFAAHLGVNDAAVSNWERRGIEAKLRYETQQILDTELARSQPDVVARFEFILRSETDRDSSGGAPVPGGAMTGEPHLGARSKPRTTVLLDTSGTALFEAQYRIEHAAVARFRQFLGSTARVFVLAGGVGSGKSCLARYLVRDCHDLADFQLHTCSPQPSAATDLATEILRYASLPSGPDALLTLEGATDTLPCPCVVVIDGIASEEQLSFIGRQVDGILRQTNSNQLRFVLVARTPPELDLSAFPILAASAFSSASTPQSAAYALTPWSKTTTREWWDHTRSENEIPFARLPEPLQSLATIPLYSQMLHSAGGVVQAGTGNGVANGFHLIGHCVRTVLGRNGQAIEPTVDNLARIARELTPTALPAGLASASETAIDLAELPSSTRPLLDRAPDGRPRFTHDIFRAYFLAVQIAELMADRGRSSATVTAFNELADRASQSAADRNVFEFVVCALDSRAPHLIELIASAPSITIDIALPMLVETMATTGVTMGDVVRSAAQRCTQAKTRALTKAVLATPNLPEILGDQHPSWVVGQLRTHGSEIWPDIAGHVEAILNIEVSTLIVSHLDLESATEAAFLARYFDLFTDPGHDPQGVIHQLVHHLDWRVRAALGEALPRYGAPSSEQVTSSIEQLVRDDDYKVRASLARSISALDTPTAHQVFRRLLTDSNWHVREQALQGLLAGRQNSLPDPTFADAVNFVIATEASWLRPPVHVSKLATRIQLLSGISTPDSLPAGSIGLVGLLKEMRSGWIALPPELERSLVNEGARSAHWLTAHEANAVQRRYEPGVSNIQEQYRRRRGKHSLQIALDVHTLDRAVEIAQVAQKAGADFVEVGDPLIKREGVTAIETIKQCAPDTAVVAEMMSADWGRDQVELAAEAGADVVLLIGPASIASVSTAVAAARRLGVALTLDVAPQHATPTWLRDMERTGIDGFVVTTNIDLGVGSTHPLATAAEIRRCSQLPVAVSGGFSPGDDALNSDEWDIAIIGRSVADAVVPADTVSQLARLARKIRTKEDL
ncbi:orotidine 5'-phosphate decarboxylase / HUMPS family protein [Nocardia fusca]|uniref:orotidine 5'-phosphate decarboxylase / HUMPS family protein n=1 Tax=Nocardia fusca TaxID=941183 RepID=UPI0037A3B213